MEKIIDLYGGSDKQKIKVIFKDEINAVLDNEKRRCIRSILYVLEMVMDKDSDQYANARKAVLDFVNDYDRSVVKIIKDVSD